MATLNGFETDTLPVFSNNWFNTTFFSILVCVVIRVPLTSTLLKLASLALKSPLTTKPESVPTLVMFNCVALVTVPAVVAFVALVAFVAFPTKSPMKLPPVVKKLTPLTSFADKSLKLASEPALYFVAKESVTVVAKLASSPKAAANSFSVSNAPGALSIIELTLVSKLFDKSVTAVKHV